MPRQNKKLFGDQHQRLVKTLAGDWWGHNNGEGGVEPVVVVAGMSGVGKTRVYHDMRKQLENSRFNGQVYYIKLPESGDLAGLIAEIELRLGAEVGLPSPDRLRDLIMPLVRRGDLVVFDEFQNGLEADHRVKKYFNALFNDLQDGAPLVGRLLMLTNRSPKGIAIDDLSTILTLRPLEVAESRQLLDALLDSKELSAAVPAEQRDDVVVWLGRNPRAMQIFVSALEDGPSLADLRGLQPKAWEMRELEVDAGLIESLEKDLMSRILNHCGDGIKKVARSLSVYRKPFTLSAFDPLTDYLTPQKKKGKEYITRALADMERRFLIEHESQHKQYWLNPVAQMVLRAQLEIDPGFRNKAHLKAAIYYDKTWQAPGHYNSGAAARAIAATAKSAYLEARHHYVAASNFDRARQISREMEPRLGNFRQLARCPIPSGEELDELIATLEILADDVNSAEVQCYLGRCCIKRGHLTDNADDMQRALEHLRNATAAGGSADVWSTRVYHEIKYASQADLAAAAHDCLRAVQPDSDQKHGKILEVCRSLCRRSRRESAIELVKSLLPFWPTDHFPLKLIVECSGWIKTETGVQSAVDWLDGQIADVSERAVERSVPLRVQRALLLKSAGRFDDAERLLRADLAEAPAEWQFSLFHWLAEVLAAGGKTQTAMDELRVAIKNFPDDAKLRIQLADLQIQQGDVEGAKGTILQGIMTVHGDVAILLHRYLNLVASTGSYDINEAQGRVETLLNRGDGAHAEILQHWARFLNQVGCREKAIKVLTDAEVNMRPPNIKLLLLHAQFLCDDDRMDEAVQLLSDVLAMYQPLELSQARRNQLCESLARLVRAESIDRAVEIVKRELDNDVRSEASPLRQYYALLLLEKGDFAAAYTALLRRKEIIQYVPTPRLGVYLDALTLTGRGEMAIEEIIRRLPGTFREPESNSLLLLKRAVALALGSNRPDWLVALGAAAADGGPHWATTRIELATLQLQFEWGAAAKLAHEAAVELDPGPSYLRLQGDFSLLCAGQTAQSESAHSEAIDPSLDTDAEDMDPTETPAVEQPGKDLSSNVGPWLNRAQKIHAASAGKPEELRGAMREVCAAWESVRRVSDSNSAAAVFPLLPPEFTGLPAPVYRFEFMQSAVGRPQPSESDSLPGDPEFQNVDERVDTWWDKLDKSLLIRYCEHSLDREAGDDRQKVALHEILRKDFQERMGEESKPQRRGMAYEYYLRKFFIRNAPQILEWIRLREPENDSNALVEEDVRRLLSRAHILQALEREFDHCPSGTWLITSPCYRLVYFKLLRMPDNDGVRAGDVRRALVESQATRAIDDIAGRVDERENLRKAIQASKLARPVIESLIDMLSLEDVQEVRLSFEQALGETGR